MKAIQVKYLAPTDCKGARFKAFIKGNSVTEPYNYIGTAEEQSIYVAELLIKKLGWDNTKVSGVGVLPNEDYVITIQ